ncbi:MAG: carboxypeptidase regulatory-like domain-containing protein [Polyangiales bacterium]
MANEPKRSASNDSGWSGLLVGLLGVAACALGGPRLSDTQVARQATAHVPTLRVTGAGRPIMDARVEWQDEALLSDQDGLVPWSPESPARVSATGWARAFAEAGVTDVELVRPATLAGHVVDTSGIPVECDIQAWNINEDGEVIDEVGHVTQTNTSGAFSLSEVAPGSVRVVARAAGFATESVVADVGRANLRLVLTPAGTLAGVVRDAAGQPARGATVVLAGSGVWPPREYQSDDDGRYRIDDVAPGVYELWARATHERSPPRSGITLEAGDALFVPLQMVPGDHVEGIVVNAEGAPIAGAEVLVVDGGLALAPIRVTTGADGRFHIEPLLPVAYERSYLAQATGYLPGQTGAAGSSDELRIVLEPGATLRGRVVDERGRPVAGALVQWLMNRRPSPAAPGNDLGVTTGPVPPIPFADSPPVAVGFGDSTSDENGEFVIAGVQAGAGEILASHGDFAPSAREATDLLPGTTIEGITLILREGGVLEGRLVDARGFPVRFVPVEVMSDEVGTPASRVSAEDGSFSFRGLLGTVTISARPYDAPAVSQTVFIQAGDRREIQLVLEEALSELSGRVLDERGFPVGGTELVVESAAVGTSFQRIAVSAEDGTFSFIALPAPPYTLRLDHPDYALSETHVSADHRSQTELALTLRPGSDVVGVVNDEWSGGPVVGAQVSLTRELDTAQDNGDGEYLATTDASGRYRIGRVLAGSYLLHVEFDAREADTDLEVLGSLVRVPALELPAAGGLALTVVDALGDRAPEAQVFVDGAPAGVTDAQGELELRGIPPGLHQLNISHPDAGDASPGRVRVLEAERSELRVMLPARVALGTAVSAEREPTSRQGVAIRVERRGEDVVITAVAAGSRAARAGLRTGDLLLRLDGEDVLSAGTARSVLRGSEGSVRVEVGRGRRRVRRTVERESYSLP